jgi:hypothetical protein
LAYRQPLAEDDFKPLPCSNPNCCSFTYVARRRPMIALTRIVKYEDHLDELADRLAFDMNHASQCCGGGWNPNDFFRIVIKPFMDAYTYDQGRVWYLFWEEGTELALIAAVCIVLYGGPSGTTRFKKSINCRSLP